MVLLCFMLIFGVLASCGDKESNEKSMVSFKPKACRCIWVNLKRLSTNVYEDKTYYSIDEMERVGADSVGTLDATALLMELSSSNQLLSSGEAFDKHDAYIENQLLQSYRTYERQGVTKSGDAVNVVSIEYRTTGVQTLTVSCPDQKLWSVEPGSSLNKNLKIWRYDPPHLVSYGTKKMLFGYTNDAGVFPESVEDWLSLSPMAQPRMYFLFRTVPDEAPCVVRFEITLQTTDGKTLRDTTDEVLINRQ